MANFRICRGFFLIQSGMPNIIIKNAGLLINNPFVESKKSAGKDFKMETLNMISPEKVLFGSNTPYHGKSFISNSPIRKKDGRHKNKRSLVFVFEKTSIGITAMTPIVAKDKNNLTGNHGPNPKITPSKNNEACFCFFCSIIKKAPKKRIELMMFGKI
ncbi:MAG: hypothetical protein RBS56_01020 [Candidatus Gracilibacteria bacterium]|nr:hypothetical protein [Candidatus Gracilibacteria bacterium]